MEKRIKKLEEDVKELKIQMDILSNMFKKRKFYKSSYEPVKDYILIEILNQSIKKGLISENDSEYLVDKNIVYEISKKYEISKYALNKNLLNKKLTVHTKNNMAYSQRRINNKTMWLFIIDKNKYKEALENIKTVQE